MGKFADDGLTAVNTMATWRRRQSDQLVAPELLPTDVPAQAYEKPLKAMEKKE
jgi:hypothetical protein